MDPDNAHRFSLNLASAVDKVYQRNILSPSYTVTIPAMNHRDLSRFEPDAKIGMRQDRKKNQASVRCLTILLRCLHDSSMDPLRLMTAALRFTTVELRMLTMPPRSNMVLVRFRPVALR